MKSIATLFLSITLIAIAGVRAQDDGGADNSPRNRGYGFLMLEEPVNPRNAAMGSVGAALGGHGFRYYNPVQPFFPAAMSHYVSAEFGRMPGEVSKGGFEAAVIFPEWFSAVSFFSSAVDFQTSDEHGLGAIASRGTTVGALSVGYIRDNVAGGVGFSMVDDRVWVGSDYSAVALSFGLGYKLLDDRLNLGAAWMNGAAWSRGFGGDRSGWHDGRVPVFGRVGAAWADTRWSFPYTVAADIVYRDEDGTVSVPVGLEVKALPSVSLRIGKRIGWENEVMSFGIGFSMDRLSFDAAFTPTVFVGDYEMKWSMGFSYNMHGRGRVTVKEESMQVKNAVPTGESVSTEEPASVEESAPTEESESTEESVSTEGLEPTEESEPTTELDPSE